jgi:hypothetical protein
MPFMLSHFSRYYGKKQSGNGLPILQIAFGTLRSKFAESIFLVHPDESKEWVINTDESGKAIGSVLMQRDEDEVSI